MAEIRKEAGGTPTYTITNEDGSAVTPQEVYDAFMSGTVILETTRNGSVFVETVLDMEYIGTPDNVTECQFTTSGKKTITLGGGN